MRTVDQPLATVFHVRPAPDAPVSIPSPASLTSRFEAMPPTPAAAGARARALPHHVLDMHAIAARARSQGQVRAPEPECMLNVWGQGMGLVGGRLRRWNPLALAWETSPTKNIQRIKLGANNSQMWAMDSGRRIARVMPDTGALDTAGAVRLPAGATDFSVSYLGRISFIEDGRVKLMQAGADVPLSLSPPSHLGRARSLNRAGNGVLYVLSDANELWQMSSRRPAGGDVSITGPEARPEYWQRLTTNAFAADPRNPPQPALDRLQTLPDGGLGAVGAQGLQRFDPASGVWRRTELGADSEMNRFYQQFKSDASEGWESAGQGLLFPDQSSMAAEPGWSVLGLMKAIADKRKGLGAHLGVPTSSAGVAGAGDLQRMQAAMHSHFEQMGNSKRDQSATLSQVRAVAPDWCASIDTMLRTVDDNTARALDALEKEGADPGWGAIPPWLVFHADHNALQALLMVRWKVLGRPPAAADGSGGDPLSRRIATLLSDGWYLPVGALSPAFQVPVGKMLHDHALMLQAVNTTAQARNPAPALRMQGVNKALHHATPGHDRDAWTRRLDGGPGNTVSTLFHRALAADGYAQLNDASVGINAGMRDASHKLLLAMAGPDGAAAGPARLAAFVGGMRPDQETISLKFGQNGGLDLDGLGLLFNLCDPRKTGLGPFGPSSLPFNRIPILQLLGSLAHASEITLDISRTDTGIKVVIGHSGETSGALGAAASWGLGAFLGEDPTGLAFGGLEVGASGRASRSAGHSVALEFAQDDEGRVEQVLHDLFSGQASLDTLLERADLVTSASEQTRKGGAELYGAALVSASVAGAKHARPDGRSGEFSLALMPVEQLNLSGEYVSARSRAQGSDGRTELAQRSSVDGKLSFIHATVLDAQHIATIPLAPDVRQRSMDIVSQMPLLVSTLSRPLWATRVSELGASVGLAADGSVAAVTATFATTDAALRSLAGTDLPLTVANFPQLARLAAALPGVQPYLDKFNRHPRLRPTVTMAFTPAALDKLRASLPRGATEKQLGAAIAALRQDPEHLCITGISAEQRNTFETKAVFGFGLVRYSSSASNALSSKVADLSIAYDGAGATSFAVGGAQLLDGEGGRNGAARPDLDQLRDMAGR